MDFSGFFTLGVTIVVGILMVIAIIENSSKGKKHA